MHNLTTDLAKSHLKQFTRKIPIQTLENLNHFDYENIITSESPKLLSNTQPLGDKKMNVYTSLKQDSQSEVD